MYEETLSVSFVRATDEMLETPSGPSRYIGKLESTDDSQLLFPAGFFLRSPFGNESMFCAIQQDMDNLSYSARPLLDQAGSQNNDERIGVFVSFANKGFLYLREDTEALPRVLVFKLVPQGRKQNWVYEYSLFDHSKSIFAEVQQFSDADLEVLKERCVADLQFLSLWCWRRPSRCSDFGFKPAVEKGCQSDDHWFAKLVLFETFSGYTDIQLERWRIEG